MKLLSIVILSVSLVLSACSVKKEKETKNPESTPKSEDVEVVVEDMPTFQGGTIKDFEAWVQERLEYPKIAADEGIEGKVYLMFVVETDGSISNVNVMRGVHPALDNEAIKVVKSSPKWEYQKHRGDPVSVRFSVVAEFKLE